jgi:glutamyl-tRNA synthetase
LRELIADFDISLINRNSCQLNFPKLPDYNRQALANRLISPGEKDKFVAEIRRLVKEKYATDVSESVVHHVVDWARDRLTTLHDLLAPDLEFVWMRKESSALIPPQSIEILASLANAVEKVPPDTFKREEIAKILRSFVDENGLDFKKSMHLLRLALCGVSKGPSVAEMAEILGKEESLNRLKGVTRVSAQHGTETHKENAKNETSN